jgi:DNA-binding CsgD family transcriptional regulator
MLPASTGLCADLQAVYDAWTDVNTTLRILAEFRREDVGYAAASLERRVDVVLQPLVRTLEKGGLSGPQRILLEVVHRSLAGLREPLPVGPEGGPGLSRREMIVAHLLRTGQSDCSTAAILGISRRTVASHRRRIRGKLGQGFAGTPGGPGSCREAPDGLPEGGGPSGAAGEVARPEAPSGSSPAVPVRGVRSRQLREMHRRLKALLESQRSDRDRQLGMVLANFRFLVLPLIERLALAAPGAVPQHLVGGLRQRMTEMALTCRLPLGAAVYRLTASEARVARAIRRGCCTRDIAAAQGLSLRTVEAHRLSIRRKLGMARRGSNLRVVLLAVGDDEGEGRQGGRAAGRLAAGGAAGR